MNWKFVEAITHQREFPIAFDKKLDELVAERVYEIREEVGYVLPKHILQELVTADVFTGIQSALQIIAGSVAQRDKTTTVMRDQKTAIVNFEKVVGLAMADVIDEIVLAGNIMQGTQTATAFKTMMANISKHPHTKRIPDAVRQVRQWFIDLPYRKVPAGAYRYPAYRLIDEVFSQMKELDEDPDLGTADVLARYNAIFDRLATSGFFEVDLHLRAAVSAIFDTYNAELPGSPLGLITFIDIAIPPTDSELNTAKWVAEQLSVSVDAFCEQHGVDAGQRLTKEQVEAIAAAEGVEFIVITPGPNMPDRGEYLSKEDRVVRGKWYDFEKAATQRNAFAELFRNTYGHKKGEAAGLKDDAELAAGVAAFEADFKASRNIREYEVEYAERKSFADAVDVLALVIDFDSLEALIQKGTSKDIATMNRWKRFVNVIHSGLAGSTNVYSNLKENYADYNKIISDMLGSVTAAGGDHLFVPQEYQEFIFRSGLPSMAENLLSKQDVHDLMSEEIRRRDEDLAAGRAVVDTTPTLDRFRHVMSMDPFKAFEFARDIEKQFHPKTFRAVAHRLPLAYRYVKEVPGVPSYLVSFFTNPDPAQVTPDDYAKTMELVSDLPVPQAYFDLANPASALFTGSLAGTPDADGKARQTMWSRAVSVIQKAPTIAALAHSNGIDPDQLMAALKHAYETGRGDAPGTPDFDFIDPMQHRVFQDIPGMSYPVVMEAIEAIKAQSEPLFIPDSIADDPSSAAQPAPAAPAKKTKKTKKAKVPPVIVNPVMPPAPPGTPQPPAALVTTPPATSAAPAAAPSAPTTPTPSAVDPRLLAAAPKTQGEVGKLLGSVIHAAVKQAVDEVIAAMGADPAQAASLMASFEQAMQKDLPSPTDTTPLTADEATLTQALKDVDTMLLDKAAELRKEIEAALAAKPQTPPVAEPSPAPAAPAPLSDEPDFSGAPSDPSVHTHVAPAEEPVAEKVEAVSSDYATRLALGSYLAGQIADAGSKFDKLTEAEQLTMSVFQKLVPDNDAAAWQAPPSAVDVKFSDQVLASISEGKFEVPK